jgi:hypothetical protein
MPKMTLTTSEATRALVQFIRECESDTLAAIFEHVFACAKDGTCFGTDTAEGIEFELNLDFDPNLTPETVRKELALPPR